MFCVGISQLLGSGIISTILLLINAVASIFSVWGIVNVIRNVEKPLPIVGKTNIL